LGDVDDDGQIEIVRDGGEKLFVYESDGSISSGWPQNIVKYNNNAFALGLIDDDEIPEIVFSRVASGDTYIYSFCGDGSSVPNSDGYSGPSGISVQVDSIVGDKLYASVTNPHQPDSDADGIPDYEDLMIQRHGQTITVIASGR